MNLQIINDKNRSIRKYEETVEPIPKLVNVFEAYDYTTMKLRIILLLLKT